MMIVDPGVGSKQRRILLTNGAHTFLGPDNGVFTWLYSSTEYGSVHQSIDLLPWEAYELTSSSLWLSSVSSTFHARDLFAPVAARLANGLSPGQVGERVSLESLDRISLGLAECESEFIGQVVFVDRFGNLITNIPSEKLQRGWVVVVGDETVEVGESYAGVDKGNLVALKGSHGFLEIAVNQGRADSRLQTKTGAVIKVVQN